MASGGQEVAVSSSTSKDSVEERNQLSAGLYANGILFGLQPDALFVIVPALTLPTQLAATAYISMFVVGTVAAMGSYTAVIGARRSWCIFRIYCADEMHLPLHICQAICLVAVTCNRS